MEVSLMHERKGGYFQEGKARYWRPTVDGEGML